MAQSSEQRDALRQTPPMGSRAPYTEGDPGRREGGRGGGWIAAVVGIVIAALVAWAIAAWVSDSAGPEFGATVEEVADDPAEYVGELVTVSSEVGELSPAGLGVARSAGAAGGRLAFTLDEDVLVVDSDGTAFRVIDEDSVVQVTGVVRRFSREGFADAFGWSPLADGGWFEQFEGRPAIVASSVDPTVPREELGRVE